MTARLPAIGFGGFVFIVAGASFLGLLATTEPTPLDRWRRRKDR